MRLHNGSVYSIAAQVDNDLLAPEHDQSGDAPQVTEEVFPEVRYYDDAPEAVSPNDVEPGSSKLEKASAIGPIIPKKPFWKRKRWLLLLVAVIAAIAVGVGVGVGVGARHKNASPTESLPSEIQAENSKYSLLSDTGLASVVGSSGDRRIFFQDNNGTIRQAVFHGGKWAAPTSYTITNDAKAKTPLAAILLPYEQTGQEVIVLYYMAENNSVITQAFTAGGWYNPGNQYGNSSFQAKPGSRYLSASFVPEAAGMGQYGMLVLFEGKSGNISAQASHTILNEDSTISLAWQDVTENLTLSFPSATFSAPFTITTVELGGDARLATLCRNAGGRDQVYTQLLSHFNGSDNSFARYELDLEEVDPKYVDADNADLVGISSDVDVALANVYNTTGLGISSTGPYGMVVNNSRLALFRTKSIGPTTSPSTEFPFARLATTTPVNSTAFYLYHQMNGTHIAEESYDASIGAWTTAYVEIDSA